MSLPADCDQLCLGSTSPHARPLWRANGRASHLFPLLLGQDASELSGARHSSTDDKPRRCHGGPTRMDRATSCPDCRGIGFKGLFQRECRSCGGSGISQPPIGACSVCRGRGWLYKRSYGGFAPHAGSAGKKPCPACGGPGREPS
jgi:hypothetical protein